MRRTLRSSEDVTAFARSLRRALVMDQAAVTVEVVIPDELIIEIIKRILKHRTLFARQAAAEIGISESLMSYVLRGYKSITGTTLEKIEAFIAKHAEVLSAGERALFMV